MDAVGMDWFRRGAVECRSLIGKVREKSMFDDYSITYWCEQCSIFSHLTSIKIHHHLLLLLLWYHEIVMLGLWNEHILVVCADVTFNE